MVSDGEAELGQRSLALCSVIGPHPHTHTHTQLMVGQHLLPATEIEEHVSVKKVLTAYFVVLMKPVPYPTRVRVY